MVTKRNLVLSLITLGTVVFGVFFWGYWKLFNSQGQIYLGLYVLVLGVLLLSLSSLLAIFNESVFGSTLVSLAASLPVFIAGVNIYSLGSSLLIFLANLFLNLRAKMFRKSLIKTSVVLTLSDLGTVITFFSLALSVAYFPQALSNSREFKLKIPDQIFVKIYENLTQQLASGGTLNESTSNKTAQNYFDSQIPQIRSQLLAQGISDENQIQEQLGKARIEYLNQVKQNFAAQNKSGPGNEASLIKTAVEGQLNSVIDNNRNIIPYIMAISLFFSVTFFSSIFTGLILVLVKIYLFILIKSGIVAVSKQSIEAERLVL